MTESRHHTLKSHQLPPTPIEQALMQRNQQIAQLTSYGGSQVQEHQKISSNNHMVHGSTSELPPTKSTSLAAASVHCSDGDLPTYKDEEFQTVKRVIELCFHRSRKRSNSYQRETATAQSLGTEQSQDESNQTSSQGTLVDKLTLIKSYEQTLRNQGISPIEDSRIYKLLFRVVYESEQYLYLNRSYVKNVREMANLERLSLMQNQLNELKLKSKKDSLNFGFRDVSCISQPDVAVNAQFTSHDYHHNHADSLNYQIQNKIEQSVQEYQEMETISQIQGTQLQFDGFDCGLKSPTNPTLPSNPTIPTAVKTQHTAGLVLRDEIDPEGQDTIQSTKRITKLGLNAKFHHIIAAQSAPNPVSDRQIDQEIFNQHLQVAADKYPSFDLQEEERRLFYHEVQSKCLDQEAATDNKMIRENEINDIPVKQSQKTAPQYVEIQMRQSQSDNYVMTTEETAGIFRHRQSDGYQHQHNNSSMYVMTDELQMTQPNEQFINTNKEPYNLESKSKHQSQSFCYDASSVTKHGQDFNSQRFMNNTLPNAPARRSHSSQNNNKKGAIILPPSIQQNNRYLVTKPPVDAKKTLAFKFKVQYSAAFRVFRAWKEHINLRKRQKQLKKQLLNGLVKSITKHEEVLTAKTFKALRMMKKLNSKTQKKVQLIDQMVKSNVKAFYFRLMCKKYKELQFSKNLTALAQSHFRGSFRQRLFEEWRSYACQRKEKLHKMISQLKRKPQSMQVLINFIGYHVMPRRQHGSFDTLDFYSYCSIKKRYKPNSQRLARSIEISLKHKLRRLMTAWKNQKNKVTTFRNKLRLNQLRRVFLAFDKISALSYRLKLFMKRRQGRIQEQVIIAFLQNLESVRRLSLSSQLTTNLHKSFQMKQFFSMWHDLHSFYKVGSLLKFNQKSTPLKVIHLHKKRIFNRLKRYGLQKQNQRQLISRQKQKHLISLVIGAFKSWKHIITRQRALRLRYQSFKTIQEERVRKLFFKGIVRACMIRQRQRAYREYVLMAKGLQGLAQRVDYRRMQNDMKNICDQTHLKNVVKRAFLALKTRKFAKDTNHFMLLQARQYLAAKNINSVFIAWRDAVNTIKQRKLLALEVEKFYDKKVMRKVHQSIMQYTVRRRNLAQIGLEVQQKMNQRIYRQVLMSMIMKYAKNADLKQRQKDFIEKKKRALEQRHYLFWAYKYRNLKFCERNIVKTHQHLVKKSMFSYWYTKSTQQCQHNIKLNKLLFRNHVQSKVNVFSQWRMYTERRVENRKMKTVSSYFFICKVLRRTILALRMNSIQSKFDKAHINEHAPELLRGCFSALKQNWNIKSKIKQFQSKQCAKKVSSALTLWYGVTKQANQHEEIVEFFTLRRLLRIKQEIFGKLASSGGELEAKRYWLGRLTRAWRIQTRKSQDLAQKKEQVEFVHLQLIKHSMLREWRQVLFTQFALNKIAMPYNSTVLLKTAFLSLKKVTSQRRRARLFYRRSLLEKSIHALTLFQMSEAKVKQMQQKIKETRLNQVFSGFIDQCLIRQDLRLKADDLRIRTEGLLRERSYQHWFTLCQEKHHFQPLEMQIQSGIRQKWLLKVTFAAMSRYFQIRQGKNQMYAHILNYHKQMKVERTFRKLAAYGEKRAAQKDMKHNADLLLRKHTLQRMIKAAEFLVLQKESAADEQRDRWLAIKAISSMSKNLSGKRNKKASIDKADVFNHIRLKLNVFRSLAIHTLKVEKARLSAASRRSVILKMNSSQSHKLGQHFANIVPKSLAQGTQKTKCIKKTRTLSLSVWSGVIYGSKQSRKLQDLLGYLTQGRLPLSKKASKVKSTQNNRSNRHQRLKRAKITKSKKQTRYFSPPEITQLSKDDGEIMIEMEDMQFEEEEIQMVSGMMDDHSNTEDVIEVFRKKPDRGLAVKSAKPATQSRRYQQVYSSKQSLDSSDNLNQSLPSHREVSSKSNTNQQLSQREAFNSNTMSPIHEEDAFSNQKVSQYEDQEASQAHQLGSDYNTLTPPGKQKSKEIVLEDLQDDEESARDIKDFTRGEDSSLEQIIGIEDCQYQEDDAMFGQASNNAFSFNGTDSLGVPKIQQNCHQQKRQMEIIGSHLDNKHSGEQYGQVLQQEQQLNFVEDKWDRFFQNKNGAPNGEGESQQQNNAEQEEFMHTMPSFREGGDECEKTLSVIYDDTDLARDHLQSFGYTNQYVTSNENTRQTSPMHQNYTSQNDMEVTVEPIHNSILTHMVVPLSPQYETNEPELLPPRPKVTALRASNQEIEDELHLYSTVQSYEKTKHFSAGGNRDSQHFPPTPNIRSSQKGNGNNSWLQSTLKNRLNQSGQIINSRRSGSWKPNAFRVDGGANATNLSCSIVSGHSLRSSTQTRVYSPGQGKDNKIMQKIVENLSYLNMSRENF